MHEETNFYFIIRNANLKLICFIIIFIMAFCILLYYNRDSLTKAIQIQDFALSITYDTGELLKHYPIKTTIAQNDDLHKTTPPTFIFH